MNKENKRGWYTSDGCSIFTMAIWVTIAMAGQQLIHIKIPGTTETDTKKADGDTGKKNFASAFVGTSKLDDANATATMDFHQLESNIDCS